MGLIGRRTLGIHHGAIKLLVLLGEHVALGGIQGIVFAAVVLVTEECAHGVLAEVTGVVEELLGVPGIAAGVGHGHGTARGAELAVVRVVHVVGTGLVERSGSVDGQGQALDDVNVDVALGGKRVTFRIVRVVTGGEDRVGVRDERTGRARDTTGIEVAVTVIEDGDAVHVIVLGTVSVADVERIDRGDLGRVGPDVTGRAVVTVVAQLVEVELGVGHVGTDLEPVLGLVVSLQTGGQTLVVGLLGDTVVVQVADGGEVGQAVLSTGDGERVLLTETLAVHLIGPVVGLHHEVAELVALDGVRVELAVTADGVFASGEGVGLIAQTAGGDVEQVVVCTHVSLFSRQGKAVGGDIVVIESFVVLLVVGAGIGEGVVLLESLGVETDLGVEGHHGLADLTLLGGDHDHTVGATGAVQGVGSRILEDGHGLDIARGDVVHVAVVRHTVDDDERILTCVDGGDTTHADGSVGTRSAAGGDQLDTSHLAGESVRGAGDLRKGKLLIVEHLGGTGKGFLRGLTEGHDDGLGKHLGISLEGDIDDRTSGHGNLQRLETKAGEGKGAIGRDRNTVVTVDIRHRIGGRAALKLHGNTCDSISVGLADNAGNLHILCGKRHAKQHKQGAEEQFCFFHKQIL